MKRIFSFSLGNIWSWTPSKNRNDLIKYARKLDVSGVEVTFAYKEEAYAFKLSENNRSWLRQLDYVTIHAPFRLVRRAKDEEEVIKQLDMISRIYDDINAKDVIIHPIDLPAPEILKRYDFNISTENLPPKCHIAIPDLRKILHKYSKMGLCLDAAHAYLWSKYETGKLIEDFADKISQIHFSGTYRNKDHQSLRNFTKNFLESIQPIKELDVPIVIEEDIKVRSLDNLVEEVEYVKSLFD